jgi:hypothetical protein
MVEIETLGTKNINNQDQVIHEVETPRTIDDVVRDYESSFHSALFENDDECETDFDIECARKTLVDEGLSVVKTISDCDRILSELNVIKNEGLINKVLAKRDSIEFAEIIHQFDARHKAVLEEDVSSDDDSEAVESIRCSELRLHYFSRALEKASTQQDCMEILGRTFDCPEHAYIRQLINEKMAGLPIDVRH